MSAIKDNRDAMQTRKVGRPAKLTLDQVLDAAIELGIEDVSIANLAESLGTGIAAIYRVVESRDELMRLAAGRFAQGYLGPTDRKQGWATYMLEFIDGLFHLEISEPSLIVRYIDGGLGPEFALPGAERVIGALCQRGFTPEEAFRLLQSCVLIGGGGVARHLHLRRAREAGRPHDVQTRAVLENAEPGEFEYMKGLVESFSDESKYNAWRETLVDYLVGVAASRGEAIDPDDLKSVKMSPG